MAVDHDEAKLWYVDDPEIARSWRVAVLMFLIPSLTASRTRSLAQLSIGPKRSSPLGESARLRLCHLQRSFPVLSMDLWRSCSPSCRLC